MIRAAQLLLIVAAAGLWAASRLPWVTVQSADGLGPVKTSTIDGALWSNALLPLALLLLAAALAGLAVRGMLLRAVSLALAVVSLLLGYLGVSLFVTPDVGPRGAELAGVQIAELVHSQRHHTGAVLTAIAAVLTLLAAVAMMRAAASAGHPPASAAAPRDGDGEPAGGMSERRMWDAIDEGRDPTAGDAPDSEGR